MLDAIGAILESLHVLLSLRFALLGMLIGIVLSHLFGHNVIGDPALLIVGVCSIIGLGFDIRRGLKR